MGSKQRRQRERQELRQAILAAARDIAAREGWQAVTIRKVAEAIEYTPPIIYEYFASKEALLFELLREGFWQVGQIIQAIQARGGPAENVLAQVAIPGDAWPGWRSLWHQRDTTGSTQRVCRRARGGTRRSGGPWSSASRP